MQRITAVALVPLTLWMTASLFAHAHDDYGAFILWLRTPLTTVLTVLLLIALFYHTALGLQVVIEDYVHTASMKISAVALMQLVCCALAVAGIITALSIAFSG